MFWVQSAVMNEPRDDEIHAFTVTPEQHRVRLDRLLSDLVPSLSRTRIKALILDGRLAIAGRTVAEPSLRVNAGDDLVLAVPPAVDDRPRPQSLALEVVYEDEHLIVIDKPAGMVVHPAPGNPDNTLVNALLAHCGDSLSGIGGVRRPGIVHRLDKDTSGLMVAAKDDAAHAGLSALFAAHDIVRRYDALVRGTPRPGKGRIEGNIGRSTRNRQKMAIVTRGGRHAVTHYETVETFAGLAALVRCRLETGRTHQIRVHMASIGHPVLGDRTYGRAPRKALADATGEIPRQALHAAELGFVHPISDRNLHFTAPLPDDMRALRDSLLAADSGQT